MSLRKAIKTRGAFPSEEAALKVMYLALRNVIAKWECPLHWKASLNHFTMLWEDRIRMATVKLSSPQTNPHSTLAIMGYQELTET